MRRHVWEQCLLGVEYLHAHGMVHLLIRPSHVFVDERYAVKLGSSGLGRSLLGGGAAAVGGGAGELLGAAGWRARELLDGGTAARVSSAADSFSLGCLGYFLLTHGGHPFGQRPAKRDDQVLAGDSGFDIKALAKTEPEAYDLIASMIQVDPAGRPTAAAARRHPYFWDHPRRAAFICNVSALLSQDSNTARTARKRLNTARGAGAVVRDTSWDILLDAPVVAYLATAAEIEGRPHDRNSVHDLLRLVAFTLAELEPQQPDLRTDAISSAAVELIEAAGGTLPYFMQRFPSLLMFTYWHVFAEAGDAKGRLGEFWAELQMELHG